MFTGKCHQWMAILIEKHFYYDAIRIINIRRVMGFLQGNAICQWIKILASKPFYYEYENQLLSYFTCDSVARWTSL